MDSFLITLVIMALSALASWAQKRKQGREEWWDQPGQPPAPANRPARQAPTPGTLTPGAPSPMPPASPPRPPTQVDWEREIRRLFGEEEPAPPPARQPPVAPAPPPIAPKAPAPRTVAPPPRRAPVLDTPTLEDETQPTLATGSMKESSAAYERGRQLRNATTERMRKVDAQPEAAAASAKGISLRANVAARMRGIDERMAQPISAKVADRRTYRPAGGGVRAMLRRPESLRTALVASTILGQPKSMGEAW